MNLLPVIFTALTVAMAMGAMLGSRIPLGSQDLDSATNLGQILPDPAIGDDISPPETPASPTESPTPTPDVSPTQTPIQEDTSTNQPPPTDSESPSQNQTAQENQSIPQDSSSPASSTTASSDIPLQPRQTSGEAIPALW